MRKKFGMLVVAAVVGASLLTPDAALARRCGRHHRNRGCYGANYCSPCGGTSNGYGGCGTGCATGCGTGGAAGYGNGAATPVPAPAMGGPPPAPGDNSAPPPVPAPGA